MNLHLSYYRKVFGYLVERGGAVGGEEHAAGGHFPIVEDDADVVSLS